MAATPDNPNQAIDFMVPITTAHIILMIVLAVAAVATIIWGSTLARRRRNARKQVAENFETAEAHGATHEPTVSSDGTQVATLSDDVLEDPAPVPAPSPAPAAPVPAPAAPAAPAPVVAPAATGAALQPAAQTSGGLTQIKGLGPKLATTLAEQGITRVEQIAALTPAEAETLDAKLGAFRGRMARDRWIEQAKLLSAGDRAGYEAAFGKLGG